MNEEDRAVQAAAKNVFAEIGITIGSDSTEASIATTTYEMLSDLGYPDTWYYSCPALVLLGSRSCLSVSGKDYKSSEEPVGENNLVTIDLSPSKETVWGDCARSFPVEDGHVVAEPRGVEFADGIAAEACLHEQLVSVATPDMTFSELHELAVGWLKSKGYDNLDLMMNFGHSIAESLGSRIWLDADNYAKLASVKAFTFEPHIRKKGGLWGFKHENIYFFEDGILREL